MANDWKNIFMDEDAPEQPVTDLPTDNEKAGEDNGQGSEAAGALSENDDPEGMETVPAGEDEITGTKSTEYADVFAFLDENEDGAEGGEEQPEDADEAEGDEDKGDAAAETSDKKRKAKKTRRNSFSIFDEDAPEEPTVDLPTENEKEGEDNGQGSEAAGALSESGNDEGIKDVPAGEDEITGTKSTEYADVFAFLDEDEEAKEEGEAPAEEGKEEGKDAEEAAEEKSEDKKRRAKKTRRNAYSFLFDEDEEVKEGDDKGEEAAEGEEDKGSDDVEESKTEDRCSGKKKSKKSRRNEFSWLFDEDGEEGEEEKSEGTEEAEGEDEKPAEGEEKAEDKKRKAKKTRRNADDSEGSDDDGASEKEPVGEPDAEEAKEGEDKKEEEATEDSWSSFFDEGFEEPENLPGDPKSVKPVDGNGNEICPVGDPDLPEKELTEPVLVPVETENGDPDALKNKHISNRYFFN